jgi:hypothetical protein
MAIEKLEKNNGTCQLMYAVDNPIPFWATSHRDLGCPWATLPILDFRIPENTSKPLIGCVSQLIRICILISCSSHIIRMCILIGQL